MVSATLAIGLLSAALAQVVARDSGPRWCNDSFQEGLLRAVEAKRPALAYFWMDGSDHCERMLTGTLADAGVQKELAPYLCLRVDIAAAESAALVKRYHVTVVPTVLVLTPEGAVDDAIVGFVPANELLTQLRRIQRGIDTVTALKARIERNPDDLQARLDLARKLQYTGDEEGFDALLASIREADPKGRTVVGAQLQFRDLSQSLVDAAAASNPPQPVDLGPAYESARKARHDLVAFEAWQWISAMEDTAGRPVESREALARAWERVPEDQRLSWGPGLVRNLFEARVELQAAERRFAMKVATTLVKEATSAHRKGGGGGALDQQLGNAHTAMACACAILGQRDRAQKAMKEAMSLLPPNDELDLLQQQILAEPER